jgi:tRNA pseudouridine55 synthase
MSSPRKIARRSLDGVLLLDKPLGWSSNQILQRVKYHYRAKKAGHTGSLDPAATGLLPLCFGHATKLSSWMLDADKTYQVTGRLGVKTNTGDAEGETLFEATPEQLQAVTLERLTSVLDRFRGEIEQIPPMFSALKYEGERLYSLARRGIEVERKPRTIRIEQLTLLSAPLPEFTLEVTCSKGTYIRTLIEDIGTALECGAYVVSLRRTAIKGFPEALPMVTLSEIEALGEQLDALDRLLQPLDIALEHLPEVELDGDSAFYFRQGQAVRTSSLYPTGERVRVYLDSPRRLLAIGEMTDDGRVTPRRMLLGANS